MSGMTKPPPRQVPESGYVVAALLIAIAALVIAVFTLSLNQFFWAVAIVSLIGLAWRWWHLRTPRDPLVGLAAILVLAAAFAAILTAGGGKHVVTSALHPEHEAPVGRLIQVYNKVTSGAKAMRDDDQHPVYLAWKRVAFCDERGCTIPGTHRETGQTFRSAVCRQEGERVTNGQDDSRNDDKNPGLFESSWYYGVRLNPETFGYINEVWVAPKDRGDLGLPNCF
jgi:hypothetical protein